MIVNNSTNWLIRIFDDVKDILRLNLFSTNDELPQNVESNKA